MPHENRLPLLLASGSPRRRAILTALGIPFEAAPTDVDEAPLAGEAAERTAVRLAAAKAAAARAAHPGRWVLAADTLVVLDGEAIGKPATPTEAAETLRRLSGRRHLVVTAMTLAGPEHRHDRIDRTAVWIRELSDAEIDAYVATGEPLDKAGAYGAQGRGAALVERIDGDFFCVIGLSVRVLVDLLAGDGVPFGIDGTPTVDLTPDREPGP